MNHPGNQHEDCGASDVNGSETISTIRDIPTEPFITILKSLLASGWEKTFEYDEFDAWVDYARIELQKNEIEIVLEWDNWCEGKISGPATTIDTLNISERLERAHRGAP